MKNKQNQIIKKLPPPFFLILVSVIFLLTVTFIYFASRNKHNTSNDGHLTSNRNGKMVTENRKTSDPFPFGIIKSNSRLRKRSVDLNVIPKTLKRIPKTFFQTWLEYISITGIAQKFTFRPAEQAEYYFYDYAETGDLFLFSIIIRNFDSAQNELIHFTCDKVNGRINHGELVAANGGEAGYSNHSKIEYSADRLTLIVTSEVSQPIDRHWETHKYVTQYHFEPERTIIREFR